MTGWRAKRSDPRLRRWRRKGSEERGLRRVRARLWHGLKRRRRTARPSRGPGRSKSGSIQLFISPRRRLRTGLDARDIRILLTLARLLRRALRFRGGAPLIFQPALLLPRALL